MEYTGSALSLTSVGENTYNLCQVGSTCKGTQVYVKHSKNTWSSRALAVVIYIIIIYNSKF